MAPPGGGPTRKSHTKSRKGCQTCKRRHIRCDELLPQCRNCTKHNVVCDYMKNPAQAEEGSRAPHAPNLMMTEQIQLELIQWRKSGSFPFPEMKLQTVHQFQGLSNIDLRLVHHLASIYRDMRFADFVGCAFWVKEIPTLLQAAAGHKFVMSSILAFSASNLAWWTRSAETKNLALQHSQEALKGLQEAIRNFSQENSDAVLATSILLAWQASSWSAWTSTIYGTSTVINSMAAWKDSSRFAGFLCDNPRFFSPTSTVLPVNDQALSLAILALQQLAVRLPSVHPVAGRLQQIIKFAEDFEYSSKSMQSEQIFEKLHPLREWIFWVPVELVKSNDMSSAAMVFLAQLYTLAFAIDSSIPELSGAALGCLSVQAIEQLDHKLCSKMTMTLPGEMSAADINNLMEYPRLMITQNRLEQAIAQDSMSARERQGSPYSFHRPLSIGSQPGTPNYPPPGSPGLLNPWQNSSVDDLSMPPSPFLNYGAPVSRRHSAFLEMSPMPSEHSFDNRSLSAYDVRGDSPAYSPITHSPSFLPDLTTDDSGWDFDVNQRMFAGSESPYDESAHGHSQPYTTQAGSSSHQNLAWSGDHH